MKRAGKSTHLQKDIIFIIAFIWKCMQLISSTHSPEDNYIVQSEAIYLPIQNQLGCVREIVIFVVPLVKTVNLNFRILKGWNTEEVQRHFYFVMFREGAQFPKRDLSILYVCTSLGWAARCLPLGLSWREDWERGGNGRRGIWARAKMAPGRQAAGSHGYTGRVRWL